MSDLPEKIFMQARTQYDRALRWAFILVIIAVGLHLSLFSETLNLKRSLSTNESNIVALKAAHDHFDSVSEELTELRKATSGALEQELRNLVMGLRTDFSYLDSALQSSDSNAISDFDRASMAAQTRGGAMNVPFDIPTIAIPASLIEGFRGVGDTNGWKAFRKDSLVPFVTNSIIRVRFAQTNREWKRHAQEATNRIGEILEMIRQFKLNITNDVMTILKAKGLLQSPVGSLSDVSNALIGVRVKILDYVISLSWPFIPKVSFPRKTISAFSFSRICRCPLVGNASNWIHLQPLRIDFQLTSH